MSTTEPTDEPTALVGTPGPAPELDHQNAVTDLDPTPAPAPAPRPIAVAVGKRERTRLAKAELLMRAAHAARNDAQQMAEHLAGWPDYDPLKQLCHTYGLTPAELTRIQQGIATEIENDANRRGYPEAWT